MVKMDKIRRMGNFLIGTTDTLGFDSSIMLDYSFDDGLFSILYDIDKRISERKAIEVLELIDKFYPQSSFKEDWFIKAKNKISIKEYIDNYFVYRPGLINDIVININVYIQALDGQIFLGETEEAGIEFIYDESGENPIYGIRIYPYVYFDKSTLPNIGRIVDQEKAARRNREILNGFLKSLEKVLNAKPKDISSAHSHFEDKIYEYGVKEGAEYIL